MRRSSVATPIVARIASSSARCARNRRSNSWATGPENVTGAIVRTARLKSERRSWPSRSRSSAISAAAFSRPLISSLRPADHAWRARSPPRPGCRGRSRRRPARLGAPSTVRRPRRRPRPTRRSPPCVGPPGRGSAVPPDHLDPPSAIGPGQRADQLGRAAGGPGEACRPPPGPRSGRPRNARAAMSRPSRPGAHSSSYRSTRSSSAARWAPRSIPVEHLLAYPPGRSRGEQDGDLADSDLPAPDRAERRVRRGDDQRRRPLRPLGRVGHRGRRASTDPAVRHVLHGFPLPQSVLQRSFRTDGTLPPNPAFHANRSSDPSGPLREGCGAVTR